MTKPDLSALNPDGLSIVHGIPLSEEPGLGALTLPGYLREVTQQYGPREALVMHHPDGSVERWSYDQLWANAMAIASWLEGHPRVERVGYPGLASFPGHDLATKQASGFGAMAWFEVGGGVEAGKRLMNSMRLWSLAENLGAVESIITHPATMTHAAIPRQERVAAGITDGLVRLSVGLEDVEDLIADLEQALEQT